MVIATRFDMKLKLRILRTHTHTHIHSTHYTQYKHTHTLHIQYTHYTHVRVHTHTHTLHTQYTHTTHTHTHTHTTHYTYHCIILNIFGPKAGFMNIWITTGWYTNTVLYIIYFVHNIFNKLTIIFHNRKPFKCLLDIKSGMGMTNYTKCLNI